MSDLPEFRFEAEVVHWRGPAPFFFAPLPAEDAAEVRRYMKAVTYGWGMIPVAATIAGVAFTTAMIPKDGTYFLPLKDKVRHRASITAGDTVHVHLTLRPPRR